MEVKVESKCGRCGKKHEHVVTLERAAALSSEELKKAEALALVNDFAGALNPSLHPEVIVITKNAAGAYSVLTLDNLCNNTDAKRNKGCGSRVNALIDEIFATPKPAKPRAPRKVKEKDPAAPPATNGPKGKGK